MRIKSGISSHTETPKNLMENRRCLCGQKCGDTLMTSCIGFLVVFSRLVLLKLQKCSKDTLWLLTELLSCLELTFSDTTKHLKKIALPLKRWAICPTATWATFKQVRIGRKTGKNNWYKMLQSQLYKISYENVLKELHHRFNLHFSKWPFYITYFHLEVCCLSAATNPVLL